jgi:protocatechuate 3,4-dioxygenase beta subunit/peroxiredoxin
VLKDDAPVSNAHVYVCDVINGIIQQGETETDGSFQLEIPVPEYKNWGQFNLTAVAKHPQYSYGWTGITKDNSDDLIIWLKQPKSIAGKITDESGTPIKLAKAQIRVIYIPQSGKTSMNGDYIPGCASLTDSDGNFILNGLPDGSRAYLVITGSGYARQDTDKDTDAGANGLVFRLKKGGRIEGQVIFSETGKPASGIRVYAQMPRASAESLTDENGNYVLDNLPEGAYTVTANQYHILFKDKQPDWVAVPKNFVKAMAGETAKDINIELTEGVIVSGKVTDRDTNMPIPDQQVYLEMESQSLRYEANTDINGTYKIRAIPGKAKVLLLAKEGDLVNLPLSPIANFENREVEIMEGKEISGVDFKLNKGFIFTGTVLSPEGKPVEGAEIIDRMDPFRICGRSDKDGRFTASGIKDKKPGEKLIIEARQSTLNLRSYMELEPKPGLDVNIIMERYEMTTISGRVVDGQGNPVNSADITLDKLENAKHPGSLSSSSYHEDPADSSGNYKINHVIVGDEYRVIARANGYQGSQTDQFTATANMQLKDIMLSDMGYFLEGTVKDTDGNPVVSAMVICGRGFSQTDVNGNYRIEGLENAVETGVGIKHPSYGNNTFYFIPTNQKQDFILEKPNGFLEGKVLDADGNPVANAGVSVQSRKHIWGYEPSGHVNNDAQTDSQGKFRLRDLIVNKTEDVYVYVRGIPGKMFENVEMNRDDVVFVLKQEPEPKKELTPQERQMADYAKTTWPRFTELVGKPAPSLDVAEWINGQPVKLSDLKGKLVILNFWKSWGTLQIEPLRLFNSLQKEYGKKGLVCITIHEFTTQTDELKKFVANAGVSYSIAVDKKSSIAVADGMTFDKYGVFQAPRAIIINKDGTVRGKVEPFEIEKTIQELLLK